MFFPCPCARASAASPTENSSSKSPLSSAWSSAAIRSGRVAYRGAAVVEFRIERVERPARLPPTFGDHGNGAVRRDDVDDAGHRFCGGFVDRDQPAAMNGRRADGGMQHIGQPEVDAVSEAAVGLRRNVRAQWRSSGDAPRRGVLEGRVARYAQLRRRFRELAETCALPGSRIADDAVPDRDALRRDVPPVRSRLDQHGARRSARKTHAVAAGEAHGGRAAGDLQIDLPGSLGEDHIDGSVHHRELAVVEDPAARQEAVGERLFARRAQGPDLRPVRVELFRREHGERGVGALPHVDMRDVDRHRVVRGDLQPAGDEVAFVPRDEVDRLPVEGFCPTAIADDEAACGRGRADEEGAPPHACPPAAALWIAARTRG